MFACKFRSIVSKVPKSSATSAISVVRKTALNTVRKTSPVRGNLSSLSNAYACLRKANNFQNSWPHESTNIFNPAPVFESQREGLEHSFRSWVSQEQDKPLIINDLGVAQRQVNRWSKNLPSVQPFYAVKCNPDPILVSALAEWGTNFDCASRTEIQLVLSCGVDPGRIIFANPVKTPGDLRFANSVGVNTMTYDNADEVKKIKDNCPTANLVLRLLPDDSGSVMRFGSKFGAPFEVVESLLKEATNHDLPVVGFSFHIGSGCYDPSKFDAAILLCRQSFDLAEKLGMPPMRLVDIGGGFPGSLEQQPNASAAGTVPCNDSDAPPPFEDIAAVINGAFEQYFPEEQYPDLMRISEPGRYFGTAYSTLFLRVQGRRQIYDSTGTAKNFLYYVNDGVYGSFNCKMFDYYHPTPEAADDFFAPNSVELPVPNSLGTFFGPTCDSLDKIVEDFPMRELQVGDYIVFENMGAYTTTAASEFNGCPFPEKLHIQSAFD